MDIPKQYSPGDTEDRIRALWEANGLFHSDSSKAGEPYCIAIPPPNVTGILHMGHALNNTIQDILIRWKRMSGFNTVWLYGTDHAGIATQNAVEKSLAKEGISRTDLGREKFIEKVWEWRERHGDTIKEQLQKLGCSCDWERERFTMDDGLSRAVQEVFLRLYEKGYIYRGNYIVNWCPRCQTALSDEEVTRSEQEGKLYYIKYPIKGSDDFVIVATTRPETMLGDVAVALNPNDKRLAHLREKVVVLPILGRELRVIGDEFVDPQFGTGIVKVTPAHDPNDFLMGQRHDLPPVNVMNDDGVINENGGPYQGLDRFLCRTKLLENLDEQELLEKVERHTYSLGRCYRCDTIVEPRLSLQWFVKMKPLAEPALKAVLDGKIKFHPRRWTKVYINWMENIRDWCISRQIWWGHRMPIWYCQDCQEVVASPDRPPSCPQCSGTDLKQDEDVLDTWFSSWLWPFSTLGWPEDNEDLRFYYPTDALVTAQEIIFFWVAKMIMAGLEFAGDIPFRDVYIHGTVRDDAGTKMSKSLGNIIDPLEIIEEFGADALRFSIIAITAQGQDVFLSKEKFEIGRNFANKIWNASRFVLSNLDGCSPSIDLDTDSLSSDDVYILCLLNDTITDVTTSLRKFRFNDGAAALHDFFWHHLCDRYIEYAKANLFGHSQEDKARTQKVLYFVLVNSLKLIHPFMPFVTEAIWELLPREGDPPLMASMWPKPLKLPLDREVADNVMEKYELIRAGRNLRAEYNISPGKRVLFMIKPSEERDRGFLIQEKDNISQMLRASEVRVGMERAPTKLAPSAITPLGTVYLCLEGEIDAEAEAARWRKQSQKVNGDLERVKRKLENSDFLEKAPAEVIQKEKDRLAELAAQAEKIRKNLSLFE
jgi:valyl-tRNA synthetase